MAALIVQVLMFVLLVVLVYSVIISKHLYMPVRRLFVQQFHAR